MAHFAEKVTYEGILKQAQDIAQERGGYARSLVVYLDGRKGDDKENRTYVRIFPDHCSVTACNRGAHSPIIFNLNYGDMYGAILFARRGRGKAIDGDILRSFRRVERAIEKGFHSGARNGRESPVSTNERNTEDRLESRL